MKKFQVVAVLALLIATTGCYHAMVDTGLQPSGQRVQEKWAAGFLGGLVPPKTMETAAKCPNGVARVETQHSIPNILAGIITGGIYTPMTIEVQCAAPRGGTAVLEQKPGESPESVVSAALQKALDTGMPVFIDLR